MKTLNTLIKELQAMVEEDESVGECPVYVYSELEHTFMQAYVEDINYRDIPPKIRPTDIPEADDEGEVFRIITIGD